MDLLSQQRIYKLQHGTENTEPFIIVGQKEDDHEHYIPINKDSFLALTHKLIIR